jgi:hypothetical protein
MVFIAAFVCLLPAVVMADQLKKYVSEKARYSLAYPAEWYMDDKSDELELASQEGAFESDGPGAGVSVMVKEADADDEGKPEKALKRIMGDIDSEFQFGHVSTRMISGREWHDAAFSSEKNQVDGHIYVLLRGVRVYVIGLYNKRSNSPHNLLEQAEAIIDSFQFAKRKLKEFHSKGKGLSFRYPDIGEIKEEREAVTVLVEGDEPDSDDAGVMFTVGIIGDMAEEMKGLDEQALMDMLMAKAKDDDKFSVIEKNKPIKVMGDTWYQTVIAAEEGRMTIALRRYGDYFFAVAYLVSPAHAHTEYAKAYEVFLSSLKIDTDTWAAHQAERMKRRK